MQLVWYGVCLFSPTVLHCNVLQNITFVMLLTCENVCDNDYCLILQCWQYTYHMAGKFDGEFNLTFFALTVKLISVNVNFPLNFPYTMCLLTAHFVKLKSVIFLLCNLEAILSNFIPIKFSGHTVCKYIACPNFKLYICLLNLKN